MTLAAVLALVTPGSQAGQFGVTPLRLDLDRGAKTGALTVTNDSADQRLQLQMKLFAWRQDEEGKDLYEESKDLTYFPRMATLDPKGSQLLRVGVRVPAAKEEQAYRLFVEEIPQPRTAETRPNAVAVAVRFGVPVFVKPLQEEPKGQIESVDVGGGRLAVRVRNTGNVHFMIKSVALEGGGYSQQLQGWYLLPGAERTYTTPLGADACRRLGTLAVKLTTDRMPIERSVGIDPASCR